MIHRVRGPFITASILQIYLKLSFEKMIHRVQGSFFMASILQTSPADTRSQQEYFNEWYCRLLPCCAYASRISDLMAPPIAG
jgi:hypothetical protein